MPQFLCLRNVNETTCHAFYEKKKKTFVETAGIVSLMLYIYNTIKRIYELWPEWRLPGG